MELSRAPLPNTSAGSLQGKQATGCLIEKMSILSSVAGGVISEEKLEMTDFLKRWAASSWRVFSFKSLFKTNITSCPLLYLNPTPVESSILKWKQPGVSCGSLLPRRDCTRWPPHTVSAAALFLCLQVAPSQNWSSWMPPPADCCLNSRPSHSPQHFRLFLLWSRHPS